MPQAQRVSQEISFPTPDQNEMPVKIHRSMRVPQNIALTCLGAFLLGLSCPGWSQWFFIFICYAPLIYVLRWSRNWKEGLAYTSLFGIVTTFVGLSWLTTAMTNFFGLSVIGAVLLTALFGIFSGFLFWLKFYFPLKFAARFGNVWAAAVGTLFSYLFYDLNWWTEGNLLSQNNLFLQPAQFIGAYGLAFFPLLIGWDLAKWNSDRKKYSIRILIVLALLVVVGKICLNFNCEPTGYLKVLGIQMPSRSMVSQEMNHQLSPEDPNQRKISKIIEQTEKALSSAEGTKPDLIVWPEGTVIDDGQRSDIDPRIGAFAKKVNSAILYNTPRWWNASQTVLEAGLTNSNLLVSANGMLLGQYHKSRLAPFEEEIPTFFTFPPIRLFLKTHLGIKGRYLKGEGADPVSFSESIKIGSSVCIEGYYPAIGRTLVEKGADVLINLSSLEVFAKSAVPQYSLLMVRTRAVENGRSAIQVARTGPSQAFDLNGNPLSVATSILSETPILASLPIYKHRTLYSKYGDWFLCLLLVVALFPMMTLFPSFKMALNALSQLCRYPHNLHSRTPQKNAALRR